MENDYKVADISLAEFGRREISLAENVNLVLKLALQPLIWYQIHETLIILILLERLMK